MKHNSSYMNLELALASYMNPELGLASYMNLELGLASYMNLELALASYMNLELALAKAEVPSKSRKKIGDAAFVNYAPVLWNILPIDIREANSLKIFKRKLKTYLFTLAFN